MKLNRRNFLKGGLGAIVGVVASACLPRDSVQAETPLVTGVGRKSVLIPENYNYVVYQCAKCDNDIHEFDDICLMDGQRVCPSCYDKHTHGLEPIGVLTDYEYGISPLEAIWRYGYVVCSRCGKVVLEEEKECCWYCNDWLCPDCFEDYGHCGHPEADAQNERARKVKQPIIGTNGKIQFESDGEWVNVVSSFQELPSLKAFWPMNVPDAQGDMFSKDALVDVGSSVSVYHDGKLWKTFDVEDVELSDTGDGYSIVATGKLQDAAEKLGAVANEAKSTSQILDEFVEASVRSAEWLQDEYEHATELLLNWGEMHDTVLGDYAIQVGKNVGELTENEKRQAFLNWTLDKFESAI